MKNLFYFKSCLVNRFPGKNIFIEFTILKDHDNNVTQMSYN